MKTPLRIGSYDDGGMISDADGNELFSVGQNEDSREMMPHQKALAEEVVKKLSSYEYLEESANHAWSVAKSLQAQVNILEQAVLSISRCAVPDTNDAEHDMLVEVIAHAQGAIDKLREHRGS